MSKQQQACHCVIEMINLNQRYTQQRVGEQRDTNAPLWLQKDFDSKTPILMSSIQSSNCMYLTGFCLFLQLSDFYIMIIVPYANYKYVTGFFLFAAL